MLTDVNHGVYRQKLQELNNLTCKGLAQIAEDELVNFHGVVHDHYVNYKYFSDNSKVKKVTL